MKALTIHQPWAWAIAAGHKPVENRTWTPPPDLVGQWFAIHAGKKKIDLGELESIRRETGIIVPDSLEQLHLGAVVAVAVLDRYVYERDLEGSQYDTIMDSPWFMGPVGWVLRDVVAIEPVFCNGFQKLWDLKPSTLKLVRENFRKARDAKQGEARP